MTLTDYLPPAPARGQGCLSIVRYLCSRDDAEKSLTRTTQRGSTCFHAACMSGHATIVKWLAADERGDVNAVDARGCTALLQAARCCRYPIVRWLAAERRVFDDTVDDPAFLEPFPKRCADILAVRQCLCCASLG